MITFDISQESVKHKKDHERAVQELNTLREENQQLQALRKPGTLVVSLTSELSILPMAQCSLGCWTIDR
jgi:hypothetical protein